MIKYHNTIHKQNEDGGFMETQVSTTAWLRA